MFYPVIIWGKRNNLSQACTSSELKQKLKTIACHNKLLACVKNVQNQNGILSQVCFKSN